jgi:PAS domain S-box-containing protein
VVRPLEHGRILTSESPIFHPRSGLVAHPLRSQFSPDQIHCDKLFFRYFRNDKLIQLVNRRTEEMFGYERSELIGQPLEILLPERYHSRHVGLRTGYFAEPRLRAMGAGVDLAGRRKDGTEFPVEIGLSPVQTEEGQMALGLISDITERKQAVDQLARANDELRGSNAQLEQFAYVASHDLQEPLRMVSSYLELLECMTFNTTDVEDRSLAEPSGVCTERLVRLKGNRPSVGRSAQYSYTKGSLSLVSILLCSSGPALAFSSPKDDPETTCPADCRTGGLPGLISDITERKQAVDHLARANAQLRSYLEAASQGILAVSSDGLIQLVNRRTEEMFGYERSELIGQPLEILLPERYHSRHVGLRTGYFAEPRLRAMGAGVDLAGRRKDGTEFPVEIGLSPVQTEEGQMALGLISDITERKQAVDQLARANDEP